MGYRLSLLEKKCFQFKLNVKGGPTLDVNNFSEADADKCSQKRIRPGCGKLRLNSQGGTKASEFLT